MSSMNSRLKGFGFGKRRSTASIHSNNGDLPSQSTPPPTSAPQLPPVFPSRPGPAPSIASNSSQQSLPMNHPGAGARPPSYSANFPPNQGLCPVLTCLSCARFPGRLGLAPRLSPLSTDSTGFCTLLLRQKIVDRCLPRCSPHSSFANGWWSSAD